MIAMSHEQLLLWLDERLGAPIRVSVEMGDGDHNVILATLEGTLHRPRKEEPQTPFLPTETRPDVTGLYGVGEGPSFVDFSAVPAAAECFVDPVNEGNTVLLKLGDSAWLTLSGLPA